MIHLWKGKKIVTPKWRRENSSANSAAVPESLATSQTVDSTLASAVDSDSDFARHTKSPSPPKSAFPVVVILTRETDDRPIDIPTGTGGKCKTNSMGDAEAARPHDLTRETYTMSLRQLRQERQAWRVDRLELEHLRKLLSTDNPFSTGTQLHTLIHEKAEHEEQLDYCREEIRRLQKRLETLKTEQKELQTEMADSYRRHDKDIPSRDSCTDATRMKELEDQRNEAETLFFESAERGARRIEKLEQELETAREDLLRARGANTSAESDASSTSSDDGCTTTSDALAEPPLSLPKIIHQRELPWTPLDESALLTPDALKLDHDDVNNSPEKRFEEMRKEVDDVLFKLEAAQHENEKLRVVKDSLIGIDRDMEELIVALEPLQDEIVGQTNRADDALAETAAIQQELNRETMKRLQQSDRIQVLKGQTQVLETQVSEGKEKLDQVFIELKNEQALRSEDADIAQREISLLKASMVNLSHTLLVLHNALNEANAERRKVEYSKICLRERPLE